MSLGIFSSMLALAVQAPPRAPDASPYVEVAALCSGRNVVLKANNANILCMSGAIDARIVTHVEAAAYRIDYAVVDSAGGRVDLAMTLGRRLFADRTTLIVNGRCMSSCANYLVPAAGRVAVLGNSAIILQGSLPASLVAFASKAMHSPQDLAGTRMAYAVHRDGALRKERAVFDDIAVDPGWLDRRTELARGFGVACAAPGTAREVWVLLDRAYLRAFGIDVASWERPPDTAFLRRLVAAYPSADILYGLDGRIVHRDGRIGEARCDPAVASGE